jgi:phosphorylase kinase alpha/beta subunit
MHINGDRLSNIFPVLRSGPTLDADINNVANKLDHSKILQMIPNQHGVYPASSGQEPDALNGMQHAWIRDNVMVAFSLLITGSRAAAARCARGLLCYAATQARRMEAIIACHTLKKDIQARPHARFCAETLRATDQPWGHAQNDAWGYLAWLVSRLASERHLDLTQEQEELLALFPRYLKAIEYYADADNGTWEEHQKVNSSSIAACIAGLRGIARYARLRGTNAPSLTSVLPLIDPLIEIGRDVLSANLPFETPPQRNADAALVFSIYPLGVVEDRYQQDLLLSLIQARLLGPYGIRRYNGDSYYCQDYDRWFSPKQRSNDHTLSIAMRDQFLTPGFEAQWCIFDPILSVIYGRRYVESGDPADLDRQLRFANRALGQVTSEFQCPEMYFCSEGAWVPNRHTPLLWTQANLAIAVDVLKASAARNRGGSGQPRSAATHV